MGAIEQDYFKIHAAQFRKNTFDALRTFGSKVIQLKYQKDVPIADVLSEICIAWTDNYGRDSNDDFRTIFNNSEQVILDQFDKVYSEVCQDAANNGSSLDEFIGTPNWRKLYKAARTALRNLNLELPEE